MSPHRIALLFNADKVYDRQIIAGIGDYLKSTRLAWDLFMEEDFRARTVGIQHWRGDGIIADYDDPTVVEALTDLPTPIVAVGGSYADASQYPGNIPYVAADNAGLVRLAYDHLVEQGLQRFAFYGLPPQPGNRWAQEREAAFGRLLEQDGLQGVVYRGSPGSAGGWGRAQEDMVAWVRSLPKPVGIVAVTDARARQLLQACVVADIPVPEQIAVVAIDVDPAEQLPGRIPLTAVIQDTEEMGRRAAEALDRMLHGGGCAAAPIVVPPAGLAVQASSLHRPSKSPHVMHARHYIRQHAHLGIKTEQVAQHVGIPRTVLEEHFRRELKKTVHDVILEHKLEMARDMLENTSTPLADIAVRSGFTSLQYMYAVFRREYNCTPREFTKTVRTPTHEGNAPRAAKADLGKAVHADKAS